ncbi:MAG: WYL domain-containing protein, partial [Planctomycetota bacterium]
HQNSIYVVAAAPEVSDPTERLRNWKLDRFAAASVTDDRFEPDAKIDVSKFLSKSIGIFSGDSSTPVTIQLGQRSAAYVREDPWHPNQTLEPNADQPNTFTLMVPASHPREILPRVLSLGADAEVISPLEYRQTVADAVDQLARRYAANQSIQEEPA